MFSSSRCVSIPEMSTTQNRDNICTQNRDNTQTNMGDHHTATYLEPYFLAALEDVKLRDGRLYPDANLVHSCVALQRH